MSCNEKTSLLNKITNSLGSVIQKITNSEPELPVQEIRPRTVTFGETERVEMNITKQHGVYVARTANRNQFPYQIVRPNLMELEKELKSVMPNYRISNYPEYVNLIKEKDACLDRTAYEKMTAAGIKVQKVFLPKQNKNEAPAMLSFLDGDALCFVLADDFKDIQSSPVVFLKENEKTDPQKIYLELQAQKHK